MELHITKMDTQFEDPIQYKLKFHDGSIDLNSYLGKRSVSNLQDKSIAAFVLKQ